MDTGTPASPAPADAALATLREAAAHAAELGEPARADARGGSGPSDDRAFDAAEHAVRFEELHAALSAVLDELERR